MLRFRIYRLLLCILVFSTLSPNILFASSKCKAASDTIIQNQVLPKAHTALLASVERIDELGEYLGSVLRDPHKAYLHSEVVADYALKDFTYLESKAENFTTEQFSLLRKYLNEKIGSRNMSYVSLLQFHEAVSKMRSTDSILIIRDIDSINVDIYFDSISGLHGLPVIPFAFGIQVYNRALARNFSFLIGTPLKTAVVDGREYTPQGNKEHDKRHLQVFYRRYSELSSTEKNQFRDLLRQLDSKIASLPTDEQIKLNVALFLLTHESPADKLSDFLNKPLEFYKISYGLNSGTWAEQFGSTQHFGALLPEPMQKKSTKRERQKYLIECFKLLGRWSDSILKSEPKGRL